MNLSHNSCQKSPDFPQNTCKCLCERNILSATSVSMMIVCWSSALAFNWTFYILQLSMSEGIKNSLARWRQEFAFVSTFFFSSFSTSKGRNEFGKNEASSLDGSLTQYVPFDVLVFFPFRIRTFRVSRLLNLFSSFEKKPRRRSPIFSLSRSVEARLPITDQSKIAQLTMLRNSGTPQRWWELLIKQRDNCKLMTKASDFEHLYWPLQLPPTHYRRRQPRHEAQLFYFWQRDRVPLPSRLILVHRMKWQRHEN